MKDHFENATLLLAGLYQFYPDQILVQPQVQSLMLTRVLAGRGIIEVNGTPHNVSAGQFILKPWNHSVRYISDKKEPMLVSGIHIVPDYSPGGGKISFSVPHRPTEPFYNDPNRKPIPGAEWNKVQIGRFEPGDRLDTLANACIRFMELENLRTEKEARLLGQLIMHELARIIRGAGTRPGLWSPEIERAVSYVRENPEKKISAADLARIIPCSPATLTRHFQRHFKMPPTQWIIQYKIRQAATLLTTTSLRVGEIAAKVGIEDPYYFSKLFTKITGLSPLQYRRKQTVYPDNRRLTQPRSRM